MVLCNFCSGKSIVDEKSGLNGLCIYKSFGITHRFCLFTLARFKSTGTHSDKGMRTLLSPIESQIWHIWTIKSASFQYCHFLWHRSLGLAFSGRKYKKTKNKKPKRHCLQHPCGLPSLQSSLTHLRCNPMMLLHRACQDECIPFNIDALLA